MSSGPIHWVLLSAPIEVSIVWCSVLPIWQSDFCNPVILINYPFSEAPGHWEHRIFGTGKCFHHFVQYLRFYVHRMHSNVWCPELLKLCPVFCELRIADKTRIYCPSLMALENVGGNQPLSWSVAVHLLKVSPTQILWKKIQDLDLLTMYWGWNRRESLFEGPVFQRVCHLDLVSGALTEASCSWTLLTSEV